MTAGSLRLTIPIAPAYLQHCLFCERRGLVYRDPTLKGSRYSNMKELRIQSKGDPLRAFFAFDPYRTGIMLCAGKKVGSERRFYDEMLLVADQEFTHWLNTLKERE